jgi:uncharacterized protein
VRIEVRVRPGARRDQVGGCWDGPHGPALLVVVRARAVDGRANEAVVVALAEAFGLRRREVEIVTGHRGRDKLVELAGAQAPMHDRLGELLGR